MTRVLVTGAAGFVGFHLSRRLATQSGTEMYLVDGFRHGPPDVEYDRLSRFPGVTRIDGDLGDPAFVAALPDVDVVYHFAALNGTDNFYSRPWQVLRDSTLPTVNLLERYRHSGISRWLYASSSEVYAGAVSEFGWDVPTNETAPIVFTDPFNPRWSYGMSKAHGEVATVAAFNDSEVSWSILRLHNVFGPRMGDKHFIPDFICRVLNDEFWILGGDQTRAYSYVDDAVDQILRVAASRRASGRVLNIGSARERVNTEVANRILELMHVSAPLEERPAAPGSVARRCPNLSLLKNTIGTWRETPLGEGLEATIAWYRGASLRGQP